MKRFIYCIVLFALTGCVTEGTPRIEREYALENNSNFDIKINFYQTDGTTFVESLILLVNQQSNFVEIEGSSQFLNGENSSLASWPSGNAEIIFNNESILTIITSDESQEFSQPIDRNIFRLGNYESIGNNQFVFSLTDEDYNNSTPCNGPCE